MDLLYPPKLEKDESKQKVRGLANRLYAATKKLSPLEHSAAASVLLVTTILGAVGWGTHDLAENAHLPVALGQLIVIVEKVCQCISAMIICSGGIVYFFERRQNTSFSRLTKWVGHVKQLLRVKYSYQYIHTNGSTDGNWQEYLRLITDLGRKAYGSAIKKDKRRRAYTKWFLANPKSFMILTANGYPIGFLCCLPMLTGDNTTGTAHYNGQCAELDIDGSMISADTSSLILQQGVFVDPAFQNEETAKLLLECYASMIANLVSSMEGTVIYAEPVSPENNALLVQLGFIRSDRKSRLGRSLYEMKLDDTNDEGYSVVQNITEKFNSFSKDKTVNYN